MGRDKFNGVCVLVAGGEGKELYKICVGKTRILKCGEKWLTFEI